MSIGVLRWLYDEDRTAYQLTLMDDYLRAYVFCDLLRDPSMNDIIRAMIAAMRQYQTIPHGVVFDNGSQFKGYLLSALCTNLGIRLMHSAVPRRVLQVFQKLAEELLSRLLIAMALR